ncbi:MULTISPECIES: KPN_02809 family neutral zinc metallopeptidase [Bacillaceae]|uniref:Metalloprotease n=1 Tax=Domibacillus aminovorans TaxID=29332 RepID=A0A177KGT3_9BACI|nr:MULTISPECIES: neutral zinc metallopeptidase [Bacillaceae]OAH52610.1 metalloprotease [Domibacillus aminovorans]OAH60177.1 metalloprotease [Domibacillus aminovorans]
MKWQGRRGSSNVEDRRGMSGKAVLGGGIGGVGLIIVIVFTLLGGNPGELLGGLSGTDSGAPYEETDQERELAQFVSVVLADTEDVWTEIFREEGMQYKEPTLVLYSGSVQSACGAAGSSVGPFYCPGDQKLYIDLSFYQELQNNFKAPGDFAMAYVIAHEVGHHVQTLLGTSQKVNALRGKVSQEEYNQNSVKLELQADYYAGVWAHHAEGMNVLEEGDLEEALTAASAVGDDTIQKRAQGYVVPESFTHGTSEQRQHWFYRGFQSGNLQNGNTFNAGDL